MTETTIPIQEAKQQLHEIIRKEIPFERKVRDVLELGRRCLDVDQGYLAQIDQVTNHWETTITTETSDRQTSSKVDRDLRETYCRETIDDDTPLALHDAPNQGWTDDPALEISEFDTYLGVPLIVDNGLYGTVCFVAKDPRSEPFSDAETWFAEHLVRLVERELEREHVETQLTSQTNLATVLNRVLRHNIRNDISIIRGYTEFMADQLDDENTAETVLNHIDDLIDLTQKARELEEIISAGSDRRHTEVGPLVEDITDPLAEEHPMATISVEYDDEINAGVLQNFDRALEELIQNALKHSDDHPTVTIRIEAVPNGVEIRIQDDGPGLPDQEAKVLSEGEESPLIHGSGLGLWLAHWIIASHDGSIEPVVTESGTTMVITIPQKPAVNTQQQLTELKRSHDKYLAAFEEGNDPKVILDNEGQILDANPEASNIYGLNQQALLGQPFQQFVPDKSDFEGPWSQFPDIGQERGTVPIVGSDGAERQVEYSITTDVVPGQHLVIGRDITERIERKEQLETERRKFRSMAEALPHGLYRADPETLETKYANEGFKRIHGYTSEEWPDSSGQWLTSVHPDDAASVGDIFRTHRESTDPGQLEYRIQTKDGDTRWVEDTFSWESDTDGNVTALVGVYTDITERKRREEELEFTKDLLAKTDRIADVGGWEIDAETNEVFWTDHLFEMLGVEYDEEPSLDEALDVYIDKDRPRVEQAIKKALSEGEEFDVEARVRRPDEEIRWLDIRGEPIIEDSEVVTIRGAVQDITEWRRRERVLREMHDIISNRQQSFEEQVQALLELGRAELGTKYGTLSEIRGEEYVFAFVDADDKNIQPGDIVPVSATYCEIVASTQQTTVLGDVEQDAPEETDRTGFTEWGISCYIGAPVFVENEVYGTFCFYDTESRDNQFSAWEETLVDLMSDWVSHELQ